MKICPIGASHSVWTDRQTGMTELIVENHDLLGYYSGNKGNSLLTFWDNLSVRFQGILDDGTDWLPETLARNYNSSPRTRPENYSSYSIRRRY